MAEVQALQRHGGDRKSEAHQGYHDNLAQRGTSSRYRIARLKRDHPAIAAALARGEYPSVHAAAKVAGFVHDPTPPQAGWAPVACPVAAGTLPDSLSRAAAAPGGKSRKYPTSLTCPS